MFTYILFSLLNLTKIRHFYIPQNNGGILFKIKKFFRYDLLRFTIFTKKRPRYEYIFLLASYNGIFSILHHFLEYLWKFLIQCNKKLPESNMLIDWSILFCAHHDTLLLISHELLFYTGDIHQSSYYFSFQNSSTVFLGPNRHSR